MARLTSDWEDNDEGNERQVQVRHQGLTAWGEVDVEKGAAQRANDDHESVEGGLMQSDETSAAMLNQRGITDQLCRREGSPVC